MSQEHDPSAYGAHIADDYDDVWRLISLDTETAVECLAVLAEDGPVLDLGIGTGRLALPLAARGLAVHGVDASPAMLERLRAKPGGDEIPVTVGDFADVRVPIECSLVVLALNTVYALPDQEAQVRCFANAAAHLRPGGRFVVDAWVPDPDAFDRDQSVRVLGMDDEGVVIEARQIDTASQRMATTKLLLRGETMRTFPANHRYAWPSELDLMARMAGLELEHRWENWRRKPFTSGSRNHVSVYVRAGD